MKIFESFSILFRSSLLSVRATNNENILLVYVVRSSAAVSQTEPEEEEHRKELAVNFEVEIPRPATLRTKPTTTPRPRSEAKRQKTHSTVSLAKITLAAKRKISLLRPHAVNLMSQGKIAVI